MTRDEAQARAAALNAERSDGEMWAPRRGEADAWQVVRVAAPGLRASGGPRGAHVESRPRPPEPPDQRQPIARSVPPYG